VQGSPLGSIRGKRGSAGVFVDFDGSLSEIAPTPAEARAVAGAAEALASLTELYRVVAVVSGRPAAQVAELLGRPPGVRWYGLYGLEDQQAPPDPSSDALRGRMERLLPDAVRAAALVPGARVEPKGLGVAVHYRGASDPQAARRVLLERLGRLAAAAGLRLLEGKKVVELAPPAGPTKGLVVERVAEAEELRAVLYAGDDVADIDAFAALERLAAGGIDTMKVAVRSAETPESLMVRADLTVEGPEGLVVLLQTLKAS
jgi:trehalose 6-phosphate phosphatase